MNWQPTIESETLVKKGKHVIKINGEPILLIAQNSKFYAVQAKCPHQGYLLSEGAVKEDCSLVCHYHNWKFDLATGKPLFGNDSLRTYAVKIENALVWVDMTPLPRDVELASIFEALKLGYEEANYGQIARSLARLSKSSFDPKLAVREAIIWSHDSLRFGFTHAYAASAAWLKLYNEEESLDRKLTCLAEAIDHMAQDVLRFKKIDFPKYKEEYSEQSLLDALENEEEEKCHALINDALAKGLKFNDIERILLKFTLNHYAGFGHGLIFIYKTGLLVEEFGHEIAAFLLKPLVRYLSSYMTREDKLAEFRAFDTYKEKLKLLPTSHPSSLTSHPSSRAQSRDLLHSPTTLDTFMKPIGEVLRATLVSLEHSTPEYIHAQLLRDAAKGLLFFNLEVETSTDGTPTKDANWLDMTHALTFAQALRSVCERYPEFWNLGLLQMAMFNARNRKFINPEQDFELKTASKDSFKEFIPSIIDHGYSHPIFSCHYLKTFFAVREEYEKSSDAELQSYLFAALKRFMRSRIKEKHNLRAIHQALLL